MADITRLSRFLNGSAKGFDTTSNTLVLGGLKIGATELTEAVLAKLILMEGFTLVRHFLSIAVGIWRH